MKKIAVLALGAIALTACQDTQPTAIAPADAVLSQNGTVDVIVALNESYAPGAHAANQAAAAQIARELGVSPTHAYGSALFGFSASVPEGRLNALRNDPRVAYVDMDAPVSVPDVRVTAKPGSGGSAAEVAPWGIKRIGADGNANEGLGIHVYVLDTGIDSDHPDLQANIGNGYAVETCKGSGCNFSWDDDHDHGTHVAGTVGAIDNDIDVIGVAAQVTLHAVKVLSNAGSGSRSGVIAGVDWVTNEVKSKGYGGKAVANMSLGGSGSKTGTCTATGFTGTDSYHNAICNSARAGVVYAVAAGNSNADAEGAVPAAYDDAVITVSATMCSFSNETCSTGTDDWPYWSNWGDNTASWTPHGSAPVAIAAPGRYVLSTKRGGGTVSMSGTSMASPHTAGAAALYLKTNAQAADYTAFSNTRAGLMAADESTDTWTNTSGYVHNEDFLNVRGM